MADSAAALAWLANVCALELHPWTSTVTAPEQPSWALFDIDPGEALGFGEVLELAACTAPRRSATPSCPRGCNGVPAL